jgi:hypothetical protein
VRYGNILYFAHPVFLHYRAYGAAAYREFIVRSLREFLKDAISLQTNLPSTARISLTSQKDRFILHLLYAPTISRGGVIRLSGGNASCGRSVEVIEELPPLRNAEVTLRLPMVKTANLAPSGAAVGLERNGDMVTVRIPEFSCHQMVELQG